MANSFPWLYRHHYFVYLHPLPSSDDCSPFFFAVSFHCNNHNIKFPFKVCSQYLHDVLLDKICNFPDVSPSRCISIVEIIFASRCICIVVLFFVFVFIFGLVVSLFLFLNDCISFSFCIQFVVSHILLRSAYNGVVGFVSHTTSCFPICCFTNSLEISTELCSLQYFLLHLI